MPLCPTIEIDLNAVLHNYACLKKVSPKTQIAAVVKNNAYGLGAREIAGHLYKKGGCRIFFVAYPFEGAEIRPVAPKADIYVLQGFVPDDTDVYKSQNLIPVISTPGQWRDWKKTKLNQRPAIQVETGLNRLGFSRAEAEKLTAKERGEFALVLTHLACADEPGDATNQKQLKNFNAIKGLFPKSKFSIAASDGYALGKDFYGDIVRAGAFLYGLNTFKKLKKKQKPVLNISAAVLQIKELTPGDSVGYGASFTANKKMKIATISFGYGDGLFRSFSPKGKVWFKGKKGYLPAPVIGRLSMESLGCDVSAIPDDVLKEGTRVTLINERYSLDDMGADMNAGLGTIGYETLSALCHGIRAVKKYKK
ncbi:MAG: alanine racemase [Lactobacillales bacterium]|jgi:alanine racemase|nr:alanine racemase [Lactobacillales bacterium]